MIATTSRRAILAGAASLATLPALASTASQQCSFPDLAERLGAIRAHWIDWTKAETEHSKLIEEKILELSGRRRRDWNTRHDSPELQEWDAVVERAYSLVPSGDPINEDGYSIALNEIQDELFEVCEEILRQHPQSALDLGLQVQAFALAENGYFTEELDGQPDIGIRRMADAVCHFCGVEPLPGVEIVPLNDGDDDEAVQS